MIFNSVEFFVFFAIFLALYYSLNHRWQNLLIVGASYVFYGWWDWRFCGLLLLSTVVDWFTALRMEHGNRKRWLVVSLVANLGVLGFFKYFNFFSDSLRTLLQSAGVAVSWPMLEIVLPVGISFYTFQTMSYVIDVYRRDLKAVRSFVDFAAFVSFWPQLVAGPILRAGCLIPQIESPRRVCFLNWSEGAYMILVGLVKKVAIADVIAAAIAPIMADPGSYSSWQLLLMAHLFAIRIYCDFSGYSDIARGSARVLGFRFPENFDHPFFAVSVSDFWRRWHISFSTWVRDYLFHPLGGTRLGPSRTTINLLIVMFLSGLWHGAGWNYVLWGTSLGILLALDRLLRPVTLPLWNAAHRWGAGLPFRLLCRVFTYFLFMMTIVIFLIPSFGVTMVYFEELAQLTYRADSAMLRQSLYAIAMLALIELPEWFSKDRFYLSRYSIAVRSAIYALFAVIIFVTWTTSYEPFIYFQF